MVEACGDDRQREGRVIVGRLAREDLREGAPRLLGLARQRHRRHAAEVHERMRGLDRRGDLDVSTCLGRPAAPQAGRPELHLRHEVAGLEVEHRLELGDRDVVAARAGMEEGAVHAGA